MTDFYFKEIPVLQLVQTDTCRMEFTVMSVIKTAKLVQERKQLALVAKPEVFYMTNNVSLSVQKTTLFMGIKSVIHVTQIVSPVLVL